MNCRRQWFKWLGRVGGNCFPWHQLNESDDYRGRSESWSWILVSKIKSMKPQKHDDDSKFLFISWESNDHQMQNPPTFQTLTCTMYQWQLLDPELELLLQKQGAQVAEQSQSSEAPLPLEYVNRLNWNMYAELSKIRLCIYIYNYSVIAWVGDNDRWGIKLMITSREFVYYLSMCPLQARDVSFERRFKNQSQQCEELERSDLSASSVCLVGIDRIRQMDPCQCPGAFRNWDAKWLREQMSSRAAWYQGDSRMESVHSIERNQPKTFTKTKFGVCVCVCPKMPGLICSHFKCWKMYWADFWGRSHSLG